MRRRPRSGRQAATSTRSARCLTTGYSASAHQTAQATCRLGIDAYWSPAVVIKADSTCPGPASRSVSAIPKVPGSSRGGATGYSQKHPNPTAVVTARLLGRFAGDIRRHLDDLDI